jgi:hypothetical protein
MNKAQELSNTSVITTILKRTNVLKKKRKLLIDANQSEKNLKEMRLDQETKMKEMKRRNQGN